MFPNHINSPFHTPPNSAALSANVSVVSQPNSMRVSFYQAVANALAVQLLNQSGDSPASSHFSTPRTPTRLIEPSRVFLSQSEGEQRSQLRAELLNWVSAAGSGLEAAERRDAAIKIVGCFHNKSHTLSIEAENITDLPSCIGLLGHLQVLDLSNCRSLISLPNVMDNFVNLCRLNLTNCQNLTVLPPTVNALPRFACLFLNGSGVDLANPLQSRLTSPQP